MRYTVSRQFRFSAAHHIEGLPAGHVCARQHGHNYTVIFEFTAAALQGPGYVVADDLQPIQEWIKSTLDYRDLNELVREPDSWQPTAEHLAQTFYSMWVEKYPYLCAVTVCESDDRKATYALNG